MSFNFSSLGIQLDFSKWERWQLIEDQMCAQDHMRTISNVGHHVLREDIHEDWKASQIYVSKLQATKRESGNALSVRDVLAKSDVKKVVAPVVKKVPPLALDLSDESTNWFCEVLGFKIRRQLGQGNFGTVFAVTDVEGNSFAYKRINALCVMSASNGKSPSRFVQVSSKRGESLGLVFPKHDSIMQTFAILIYNVASKTYRYATHVQGYSEGDMVLGIIVEYIAHAQELQEVLLKSSPKGVGLDKVRKMGRRIAQALAILHQNGFLYRDLKLENILVHQGLDIKLIDFGFSRLLRAGEKRAGTMCGSPHYIAPETIAGLGMTEKADIWAFGIVLYALAFGSFPFNQKNHFKMYEEIQEFARSKISICQKTFQQYGSLHPSNKDRDFIDLLNCLICSENERITAYEALNHPFFNISDFET